MDNQKIITHKQEEDSLKSKIEKLTKKINSKKIEKILGFFFIAIGFLLMLTPFHHLLFELVLMICGIVTIIQCSRIINNSTTELDNAKSRIQQIKIPSKEEENTNQATTYDISGGSVSFKQDTLVCPKCGNIIPGEIPEMGMCICASCKAVLMIDNYKISN